jgi:hypothetical protein
MSKESGGRNYEEKSTSVLFSYVPLVWLLILTSYLLIPYS